MELPAGDSPGGDCSDRCFNGQSHTKFVEFAEIVGNELLDFMSPPDLGDALPAFAKLDKFSPGHPISLEAYFPGIEAGEMAGQRQNDVLIRVMFMGFGEKEISRCGWQDCRKCR